jgi:hypothetical protein
VNAPVAELGPVATWTELAPLLRRAVALDAASLARLRRTASAVSAFVMLPFGVLVSRTVTAPAADTGTPADVAVEAAQLLAWLDGARDQPPVARDHEWRTGLPPARGWTRIDTVPDRVIRELVGTGALALREAAAREGVPGAQPRSATADALLDSVVLTVTDGGGHRADITLRLLSATKRMGFLPRDSEVGVDLAGRWLRVAAPYGSVFAERPSLALRLG